MTLDDAARGTAQPLLRQAAQALIEAGAPRDRACRACFVPGRIEVLGKHTDYGGGPSLVCAVERGFVAVATARDADRVMIVATASGERAVIRRDGAEGAAPSWARYPTTVVHRIARDFPACWRGADIAFSSNLPVAAGMSSSSALIIATFLALDAVQRISDTSEYAAVIHSRAELAEYLAAVERGAPFRGLHAAAGVGTLSGSEDHTAVLCAERGRLLQYSYLPVQREVAVDLPSDVTFVVAASGVRAEKSGAVLQHYNRLALQVQRLEELWLQQCGARRTLREIVRAPGGTQQLCDVVAATAGRDAQELLARLTQFEEEIAQLIPRAVAALRARQYDDLHSAVQRSQYLAEAVLRNQIEETSWLARAATQHGAVAASAFGAGFGGSVWALVPRVDADSCMHSWRDHYRAHYPQHQAEADFWCTDAGPAAGALKVS